MPDSNSTESDTPDHDPQAAESGAGEPEHLPGLEPDEPQPIDPAPTEQPDPAPRSEADTSTTAREPERYGEGGWTNEELDSWFENEHGGDAALTARIEAADKRIYTHEDTPFDRYLDHLAVEIRVLELAGRDPDAQEEVAPESHRLSEAFLRGEGGFRNLPADRKAQYRDQIEAHAVESPAVASQATPPEADWNLPLSTVTITLPDGSQLTELSDQDGSSSTELTDRAENLTVDPDADHEATAVGTPSVHGFAGLSPRLLILGGGGILSILALGFFLLMGSGDDDQGTSDAVGGDPLSVVAASPAAVSEDACTAVRQQESVLQLSSPDVQPTVPGLFALSARDEQDYPTPRLDWSTVPPETTEIVVLVSSPLVDRVDAYRADPQLWWRGESIEVGRSPIGEIRWTLIGIGPTATSLAPTSLSSPAPSGTTELFRNGTQTTRGDVDFSNKFIGPSYPGQTYLFTVFALCYPADNAPDVSLDSYGPTWLQQNSIATGWFFSDAAW
jgi:phosphatidylethanolamine-binding protein (PEBP) family uncharacterized protein